MEEVILSTLTSESQAHPTPTRYGSSGASSTAGRGAHPLVRTARTTGLLYLALVVAGVIGFMLVRTSLFVPGDATATLANLVERQGLARIGVAAELGIVLSQALLALWFYRLFRSVDGFAAGAVAGFGLVNAVAVLGSSAFLATALQVALDAALAPAGAAAATAQLLYTVSSNLWAAGNLFFGLWLIPMGWLVVRSGWMPRALGWVVTAGGAGYVLSAFIGALAPGAGVVGEGLGYLAVVGEFWMIGYLLFIGVRPSAVRQTAASTAELGS